MAQATYLEEIRQGLLHLGVFVLFSAATLPVHAQKIGEVDLTHDAPVAAAQPVAPVECESADGFTHGDGFILPKGSRLKLELNVVSLSNLKPALGDVVEAEITLKNVDKTDIMIPWATDPNVVKRPLQAAHQEYESGWLRIRLKDASGQEELLRSLSSSLYGSAAQAHSTLKLLPGQWVALHLRFQFVIDEPSHSLTSGPAELKVEWRQDSFTWQRKDCKTEIGYFSYENFYEQETNPVKVFLFSSKDEQARTNTQ